MSSKKDGPCFECPRRYFGCFADCDDYKAWRKARDERNKKISEARNKDTRLTHYSIEMAQKTKRRRKK